jgi:hypothetical protein
MDPSANVPNNRRLLMVQGRAVKASNIARPYQTPGGGKLAAMAVPGRRHYRYARCLLRCALCLLPAAAIPTLCYSFIMRTVCM